MGHNMDTINQLQMELEQLRRFKSIGYAGQFPEVVFHAVSIEQQRITDHIKHFEKHVTFKGMVLNHPFNL